MPIVDPSPPHEPADWPAYCCAIIRDETGRFLLEQRPKMARQAAGRLTCFGGTRERGEHPHGCLTRELREELGWDVPIEAFTLAVRLMNPGPPIVRPLRTIQTSGTIAWFFVARSTELALLPIRTEPGHGHAWRSWDAQLEHELGAWHRVALAAFQDGADVAQIDTRR